MSRRLLPDWLAAYLKYVENTEPPVAYHTWTAISVVAGALQRRVYLRWGHDVIYPNLYIILVGPSGRARKGTAMRIGRRFLREIKGLTLASESITQEALIRAMKAAVVNYPDGNDIKFQCPITCVSPELAVFLGQKNVKFLSALTDWYDSDDQWTYETKGSGTDIIQGVCFNLLGATAPDWIQSMLPQEAVGGGFTSRCIFVVEEHKAKVVSKEVLTDSDLKLHAALKSDLESIATICGEYTLTKEADEAYVKWYETQEAAIRNNKPPIEDPRFAGYCDRRATHIRKLSMIIAAMHRQERVITIEDFTRAEKLMKAAEVKMASAFGGLGRARYSDVTQLFIELIKKQRQIKRSDLLRLYYREIDTPTLKLIEEVVSQMKIVQITLQPQGDEVIYRYIGPND